MSTAGAVARGLVPPTRPEGFGPPDMLRTIFTHPRATMRWVLDHGDGGLWVLFLVGALAVYVVPQASVWIQDSFRPPLASTIAIAVGFCVFAQVLFLVTAAIMAIVMGGVGRPGEMIRALAWGSAPLVAVLPIVVAHQLAWSTVPAPIHSAVGFLVSCAFVVWFVVSVLTFAEANQLPWPHSVAALAAAAALTLALSFPVYMLLSFSFFWA